MFKVILGLGNGDLETGCQQISVEVRGDDEKLKAQDSGSLPPSPQLWALYQSWRSSFRNRFCGRIVISHNSGSSSSLVKQDLSQYIARFPLKFNQWLNAEGFRPIEKLLRKHLNVDLPFSLTVKAENNQLRRLPWYLWQFLEDYPHTEPALAFSKYESGKIGQSQRNNTRILVVIGDSQGIDTEIDRQIFEKSLEDTEIKILSQPSRIELGESLWDERGWDILAFLGHSGSEANGSTGKIQINQNESLSLTDLKNALSNAIKRGLKLGIFNSCDGLGLASDLQKLYLPHMIVMREPVPDKIAQEFIKNLLPAFKAGKSLSLAVREAREKLQKWEKDYPSATWLPVLCQNPAVESLNWVHLGGKTACPYQGLFAFGEEDTELFYGRESVSQELKRRVVSKLQPLVAVVGASGSGKSSVVFAGLIPLLRQNQESEIVTFRPGKDPFESLAIALFHLWYKPNNPGCDFDNLFPERRAQKLDLLITKLKEQRGLCDVIETIVGRNLSLKKGEALNSSHYLVGKRVRGLSSSVPSSQFRLVLVADQFEELYTLLPQSKEKTGELFLESLLNAVNDSPAFTLVLTLRADFFHHAIKDRKFADALQNSQYLLKPMNWQELERAIKLPAEKRGVKLEAGLLELLLDDVGEKAENLPLLEFALTQLWKKQESGWLTSTAYREIGGLQQSLARHAEDIYTHLNPEQRQRMQRVFIQLVRPGEGAADTRNVVDQSELQDEDWDLITFLNQEDARLVTINYDQNRGSTVEIVHEALISGWGRLNRWMTSHRQFRTWQERLKIGLKKWQEKERDDGYLLNGGTLGEAQEWLEDKEHREYLSSSQQEYIRLSLAARDSEEAEKKSQRQEKVRLQRRAIRWLGGGLLAAVAATGFAGFNWMQAEISATREKLNSLVATSENYLSIPNYRDALFEAMKAQQLLDNTMWKQWLSNNIEQKVKVAIHQPINSFLAPKYTLEGHQDEVMDVEFSPDGNTIASASKDKTIKLWNAKDGQLLRTLKGPLYFSPEVKFSPDGNTIASALQDGTVQLWNVKDGQLLRTLEGHQDSVWDIEFSPDGNTIASGSKDKTIKLWNVKDGQLLRTLEGHQDSVGEVRFSPDGNMIASASHDKTVKLWNVKDGQLLRTLEGHTYHIYDIEFSPNSKIIASTSTDKIVHLWSVDSGKLFNTFEGHQEWLQSVKFSSNSKIIASASRDKTIKLWNAKDGHVLRTLEGHESYVWDIEFSPDGNTIASASHDKTVKLWFIDVHLSHSLDVHQNSFKQVEFSPDGNTIASASHDKTVELWNTKDGHLLHTLEGHQDNVSRIKFSPDGNTIASGSKDKTIKLWNVKDGQLLRTLEGHQDNVWDIEFSPDGNTIASGSKDKTIKLWNTKDGHLLRTLEVHQDNNVYRIEFSPDGNMIAAASRYGTVQLWNTKNGHLLHTLEGHQDNVSRIEFNPDGNTIASTSHDGTVKLWNTKDGHLLHTLEGHQDNVSRIKFSPDGNTIASTSHDGTVKLWNTKDGHLLHILKGHQAEVNKLEFSPDGNTIASASHDGTVQLWNTKDGHLLHILKGHQSLVSIEFSPDGNTIASASHDGTIKLWNTKDGHLLHTLEGHQDSVYEVKFSPDGNMIASASHDGTIKLWNWNFENLPQKGCGKLRYYLAKNSSKLEELEFCQKHLIVRSEP